MPGISYDLNLETESFKQGAAQSMDYINQLHGRIDKLSQAGGGGSSFLKGLSSTLFQLPQQVMALQGIMSTLSLPSQLAASAETTSVAFRTLVGDTKMADDALAKVRALADKTPFEFPELADAARKLIAFGEGSETVADSLRKVGDIASGVSAPVGEIAELYGKARVQGTLFAEDINQLTGRGIPIIQEFAKQLDVSEGAIKKLASEGAITFPMLEQAFTDMTSGAGKFSGMMDATSRTMEGLLSTLSDSFKGAMSAVGARLNEALKPLLAEAADKIDGLKDKATDLGKELGKAINFGVATFKLDDVGSLLYKSLKAGSLAFADTVAKAFDWGVKMFLAALLQGPFSTDEQKQKGAEASTRLQAQGLDYKKISDGKGLGIESLSKSSAEASDNLDKTVKGIRNVADINEANAKREAATKQAQDEANRKRASLDEYFSGKFKASEIPAAPEAPLLPPAQTDMEPQGPGLPTKAKTGKTKSTPAPRLNLEIPTADEAMRDPVAAGRRTIKGAGFRGSRDTPEIEGRRTIKGAGYHAPGPEDLAAFSGRDAARQKSRTAAAEGAAQRTQASQQGGTAEALLLAISRNVEKIAKGKSSDDPI
jgi:tape measure domain-containing protein